MIQVPLANIANQSLSIQLDTNNYVFNLYAGEDNIDGTSGITSMDVIRDNTVILTGMRVVCGTPVIPYLYLENGNFIFITMNDEYPDWRLFGITQFLVFASASELEAIRGTGT